MLRQVEIGAVGDAFEFRGFAHKRKRVLDVGRTGAFGTLRVMRQFVFIVRTQRQLFGIDTQIEIPLIARLNPFLMKARRVGRMAKILDFHLLELARAESEVARRDFVAKRLADLRDAERQLFARRGLHVVEVDENALRGFGTQIRDVGVVVFIDWPDVRFEHQVEHSRLGECAFTAANRTNVETFQMVGAQTRFALFAIDQRIVKRGDVTARFPDFRVHQN